VEREKRTQLRPPSLPAALHDAMRERLEYLIELADEGRFGDCRAADRYRLALNGAVSGRPENESILQHKRKHEQTHPR
jgi:hypothetical protein